MPPRTRRLSEASQHADWIRREVGRELRLARYNAGATLRSVAAPLGWSKSKVSRVERGLVAGVAIHDVAVLAGAVGLRMSVRLYPTGRAFRDIGQLELLAALNDRLGSRWTIRHEVPMPRSGDLRAADQVAKIPGCTLMVEAFRTFVDYQAQVRSARLKQAELGADRLVMLLEDTRRNRETVRSAGSEVRRSFPIGQRAMLAALSRGTDPGGDGVVYLRRRRVAPAATIRDEPTAPPSLVAPEAPDRG